MTRFRPCIDLHAGSVKQIVGGTLTTIDSDLKTNYVSEKPSSYYAELYKTNRLDGAHVIMLGPGNDNAAKEACQAWPGKLQVGGGINNENARQWIENGAEKVSLLLLLLLWFYESWLGGKDMTVKVSSLRNIHLPQISYNFNISKKDLAHLTAQTAPTLTSHSR